MGGPEPGCSARQKGSTALERKEAKRSWRAWALNDRQGEGEADGKIGRGSDMPAPGASQIEQQLTCFPGMGFVDGGESETALA